MSIQTVLAIETSCDETSIAVLQAEFDHAPKTSEFPNSVKVLSHVVESQTAHIEFGGVVPEVAARDHLLKINPLMQRALVESEIEIASLDAIAVTLGPGLIGALMVGALFAQGLSVASGKPLIGINHVDAHLAPALMLRSFDPNLDLGRWISVELPEFPAEHL